MILAENGLADAEPRYTFVCPNCSGNFSILLERIPPVQARFRCPHCKQPMDFPSRDEARIYARLQKEASAIRLEPEAQSPASPPPPRESAVISEPGSPPSKEEPRFRVEKSGFEADVYDRRGMRNLIRTGEVTENDRIRVGDQPGVLAGDVAELKSLFHLKKAQKGTPPICCRTHTDQVAFFQCGDTGRPLCEECGPEKKFGGTTIRVCNHCGGTAIELLPAR